LLHDLLSRHLGRDLHPVIETTILDHFLELHLEYGLIDKVLTFLHLLTFQCIIQYVQHIDAVCAYLEHLFVGVDLILGLLSQLHLVLDTLAECGKWVLIVKVRFLPEHPQE
jgi:hypothetical protein